MKLEADLHLLLKCIYIVHNQNVSRVKQSCYLKGMSCVQMNRHIIWKLLMQKIEHIVLITVPL